MTVNVGPSALRIVGSAPEPLRQRGMSRRSRAGLIGLGLAAGGILIQAPDGTPRLVLPLLLVPLVATAVVSWGHVGLLRRRLDGAERVAARLSALYAKTLTGLASMIELRDEPTGGHGARVAHNSQAIGRAWGLDEHVLRALFWAGLLHDVGKVAVPDQILLKEGPLTTREQAAVRRHAAVGARLIESLSEEFQMIAEGVRTHHERWDGSGYPLGLSGEEIPLVGRIVAVADVFDALTSARPYRAPVASHEALDHLRRLAGRDFDPAVVDVFGRLYAEGDLCTVDRRIGPSLVEVPAPFEASVSM